MEDVQVSDDLLEIVASNPVRLRSPISLSNFKLQTRAMFASDSTRICIYAFPASGKTTFRRTALNKRGVVVIDTDDIEQSDPTLRADPVVHEQMFTIGGFAQPDMPMVVVTNYYSVLTTGYYRRLGFVLVYVDLDDDEWRRRFDKRPDLIRNRGGLDLWLKWRKESQADSVKQRFDYVVKDFDELLPLVTCTIAATNLRPSTLGVDSHVVTDYQREIPRLLDFLTAQGYEPVLYGPMLHLTAELDPKWAYSGSDHVFFGRRLKIIWPYHTTQFITLNDALCHVQYTDTTFKVLEEGFAIPRSNRYSHLIALVTPSKIPENELASWRHIPTLFVRHLTYIMSRILHLHQLDAKVFRRRALARVGGIVVDHTDTEGYVRFRGRPYFVAASGHFTNLLVVAHFMPIDIKDYIRYIGWNYRLAGGAAFDSVERKALAEHTYGERNYQPKIRDLWHNDIEWQLSTYAAEEALKFMKVEAMLPMEMIRKDLAVLARSHPVSWRESRNVMRIRRGELGGPIPAVASQDLKRAVDYHPGQVLVERTT